MESNFGMATDSSPVQRLMSRRTRSFLPCHPSLYGPQVQSHVADKLVDRRQRAKKYHDRNSKQLPELVVGQPVRAKVHPKVPHSKWLPGKIEAKVAPRSYLVQVNGRTYRRNRVHLRDSYAVPYQPHQDACEIENRLEHDSDYQDNGPPDVVIRQEHRAPHQENGPPAVLANDVPQADVPARHFTTRGREIKRPIRLNDYV